MHRDLKVENILIGDNNLVKISDFGLSDFMVDSTRDLNLNHTDCGTISYIAPEMIKKKGYDGTAADIWACGVILFYMVTGRKPFDNFGGI